MPRGLQMTNIVEIVIFILLVIILAFGLGAILKLNTHPIDTLRSKILEQQLSRVRKIGS